MVDKRLDGLYGGEFSRGNKVRLEEARRCHDEVVWANKPRVLREAKRPNVGREVATLNCRFKERTKQGGFLESRVSVWEDFRIFFYL